ncbi:hypothetical protein ACHAPT_013114 [Fusarium lateritium]
MEMPHANDYLDRCLLCYLLLDEGEEIAICTSNMMGEEVWYNDVVRIRPQAGERFQPPTSTRALVKVLTPDFDLLPMRQKHRLDWACRYLVGKLSDWVSQAAGKGRELAGLTSVMLMIANYLLPEYLALTAEASLLPDDIVQPSFTTSEPIWARHVEFQGVRYVASSSNGEDYWHNEAIYSPQHGKIVDVEYTAHNHLGIVKVVFAHSSEPVEVDEAPDI